MLTVLNEHGIIYIVNIIIYKGADIMLTQQQQNLKKMIKELRLKYDNIGNGSIYIEKNRKIKDIQDALFYLLNYNVIATGEYIKTGDYISVYRNGIKDIHYNYKTGRTKIELYKDE